MITKIVAKKVNSKVQKCKQDLGLFINEKFTSHHMSGGQSLTFSLSFAEIDIILVITFDFTSLMGEVHSPVKTKATRQTVRSER